MIVKITKPIQGGTVRGISSKSEAHRLLICAALSDGETFIACSERNEDIDATVRCLEALGAGIRYEKNGFRVTAIDRTILPAKDAQQTSEQAELNCGESGSTLRFMLPVCGALGRRVAFHMSGRLPSRPLTALYDEMTRHGCKLSEQGTSPLYCEGQLTSGTFTLPGNVSSQFISGLLFALPLLDSESEIHVTDVLQSRPYVDMTLDALRMFGFDIIEDDEQVFKIPRSMVAPPLHRRGMGCSLKQVEVSGDWSNAAFWLASGAIGKGSVTCTGMDLQSRQGDKAIIGLLERFGAKVDCADDTVTVSPGMLRGINIDAGDTPDLVPVLAAVASAAEGKTVIYNARRLRIKESDRLRTIASSLNNLGSDITETQDGLVIMGKTRQAKGGETQSHGDHRIAMAAAVFSALCDNPVVIHGAEAVNKSYPRFFEDFTLLGGMYKTSSE